MFLAAGTFIGGLGLFLLAVSMISEGLRLAAGNTLRELLIRSTRTSLHGIVSGAFLTALVQSSSAVTIATIGFVNVGLLGIAQAIGIVLGATVGTTMTGWLVAAIGFQFKITSFALPLVGIGMMLRLIGPSKRMGAVGEAIAGFGLFFIGVDFLRGAFEGAALALDIASLSPAGIQGILLFMGIGIVMTLLTQSSSAAIAITLTAATGGIVSFAAAAAMVIGATIGTTSTSALAVIGATPNAKRVAAAHVIINSGTALTGLLMLPLVLWLVTAFDGRLGILAAPAFGLAVFHTLFNFAGVLLIRPFVPHLSTFLLHRFRSKAEETSQPQYLDGNIMASPRLALDAFYLELQRMAALTRAHAKAALSNEGQPARALQEQHDGLRKLVLAVEHFVATLEGERLHKDVARQLPLILRISNYIDETVAQAQESAERDADVDYLLQTPLRLLIIEYQLEVINLIDRSDPARDDFSVTELEQEYQSLREHWRRLKTSMLNAVVENQVSMAHLNPAIESLRTALRVAERSTRIAVRLTEFGLAVSGALTAEGADPVADMDATKTESDRPGTQDEIVVESAPNADEQLNFQDNQKRLLVD
jgi:phosphate:Na+ symporter